MFFQLSGMLRCINMYYSCVSSVRFPCARKACSYLIATDGENRISLRDGHLCFGLVAIPKSPVILLAAKSQGCAEQELSVSQRVLSYQNLEADTEKEKAYPVGVVVLGCSESCFNHWT